jgi:PAS domain S-box-containing protein
MSEKTTFKPDEYQNLIDHSTELISLHDIDGTYLFASAYSEVLVGYPPAELIGQNPYDFFHPDDLPNVEHSHRSIQKSGQTFTVEYRFLHKNGSYVWVETTSKVVAATDEAPEKIIGNTHSIEDRKKMELRLIESEARLKKSQSVARIGHYVLDVQTGNWTSSETLDEIFGIGPDYDRSIHGWLNIIKADYQKNMQTYFMDEVIGKRVKFERVYPILNQATETTLWVHGLGELELDDTGTVLRMFGTIQDITVQKLAEEGLQRINTDLRLAQRIANVGNWTLDPEMGVPEWTDEVYRIHERDPVFGPYSITEHGKILKGEWLGKFTSAIQRAIHEGQPYDMELKLELAPDNIKWVQTICEPEQIPGSQKFFLRGTIQDITERKQADENLRKSEISHKTMIANIADVIAIVDQDGINQYKSPNIEKWFGWKPEEVVGTHAFNNVHPEDLPQVQAVFAGMLKDPDTAITTECRYQCKDNSYKWIEVKGINLLSNPAINGLLLNYHDITDRKQVEEKLREREELFEKMFREHDAVMILVSPVSGQIIDANHSALKYYGYSLNDFRTLTIKDINTLPEIEIDEVINMAKVGTKTCFEFKHKLASGEIKDVEVHVSNIRLDKQPVLFSIVHDITQRRLLREEQARSAQLAALGTVAAGVAHEINNPVQGIMNYAGIIERTPDNSERNLELAKRIKYESQRIAKITQDLLFYSKDSRLDMKLVDIKKNIEGALSLIASKVRKEGGSLEIETAKDLPRLFMQPQSIQQVVINLVDNACDAIRYKTDPTEQKTVRVHTALFASKESSYLCIEVSDNGIGMSEETIQKSQEAFFTTKPPSEGTGLGLSIINDIIKKHNGRIEIDSKEGEYTKVKIIIPAITDSQEEQTFL